MTAEPAGTRSRTNRAYRTKVITVPGNLLPSYDEFNRGLYCECHETLEEIWQEEAGDVRDLYKGLIQVAAAYVHITRDNPRGADRLFTTALGYLAPYRAEGAMGFDVDAICGVAERAHAVVLESGPAAAIEVRPRYTCDVVALPAEARRWRAWGFDREGAALAMEITVID